MRRLFFKILLEIERRQGPLYTLLILGNELFFKLYKALFGLKIRPTDYMSTFTVADMPFTIKTLDREGVEEVVDFFKRSIRTDLPGFFLPHKVDRKTLEDIMKRSSHIPLGIYHGEEFIGYGLVRLLFPDKGSYAIFVADKWQGKGIGTSGLGKMLELIRGIGFVPYSAVCKHNSRSIGMLKKLNMELAGDLGDYFEVKDKGER